MPIVVEIQGTLGVPGREIPRLESVSLIILILEMAVPLVEIHGVTQRIIPEIRGPVFPPVKPSDESLPSRPRHDLRPLADLFQTLKPRDHRELFLSFLDVCTFCHQVNRTVEDWEGVPPADLSKHGRKKQQRRLLWKRSSLIGCEFWREKSRSSIEWWCIELNIQLHLCRIQGEGRFTGNNGCGFGRELLFLISRHSKTKMRFMGNHTYEYIKINTTIGFYKNAQ